MLSFLANSFLDSSKKIHPNIIRQVASDLEHGTCVQLRALISQQPYYYLLSKMASSQRRKFNPPLKKNIVPVSPCISVVEEPYPTTSTSTLLPPSQVHTLLSFCDGGECESSPMRKFLSCITKKKRMYQYNNSVPHHSMTVTKKKRKQIKNKGADSGLSKCAMSAYDYPLTPGNPEPTITKGAKRTKEQVSAIIVKTEMPYYITIHGQTPGFERQ